MSKVWTLNIKDTIAVGKGALVAVGGAILTAIAALTVPILDLNADTKTLITVVILSVIVNICRKLVTETK